MFFVVNEKNQLFLDSFFNRHKNSMQIITTVNINFENFMMIVKLILLERKYINNADPSNTCAIIFE